MPILPTTLSYEQLVTDFAFDIPKHLNIAELICDRHARATPLATAVIEDSEQGIRHYNFSDLKRLSDNLALSLHPLGINRGDHVAIILGQNVEALIAHLAIFKLAAISVPIAGLYAGAGLTFRVNDCEASLVIIDRVGADKLSNLDIPCVKQTLVIHEQAIGLELDFDSLLQDHSNELSMETTGSEEPALIFYTSGTTGTLHGHRIVHGHLPCFQLGYEMAPKADDVFWAAPDWSWLGSLGDVVFPALYCGHPLVASPGRFTVQRAYEVMHRHQVTCPYLATAVLRKMRTEPFPEGYQFNVRAIMTGGEAMSLEVIKWSQETFQAPVNDEFGLTESNQTSVSCVLSSSSAIKTDANMVKNIFQSMNIYS